jgi:hypothetical protein
MTGPGVPRSPETRQFLPLNFEQTALIQRKVSPARHKPASRAMAGNARHKTARKIRTHRWFS